MEVVSSIFHLYNYTYIDLRGPLSIPGWLIAVSFPHVPRVTLSPNRISPNYQRYLSRNCPFILRRRTNIVHSTIYNIILVADGDGGQSKRRRSRSCSRRMKLCGPKWTSNLWLPIGGLYLSHRRRWAVETRLSGSY